MALSEDDKKEFKGLFAESMTEYESAKAEAEAKLQAEKDKGGNDGNGNPLPPAKRSFAERLLGGSPTS